MTTGAIASISSPRYPHQYHDNLYCTWIFTSVDAGSFLVKLIHFNLLTVPEYNDYDIFTIGSGRNFSEDKIYLREDRFRSPGSSVVIDDSDIWMSFTSSRRYGFKGFNISIERLELTGLYNCFFM